MQIQTIKNNHYSVLMAVCPERYHSPYKYKVLKKDLEQWKELLSKISPGSEPITIDMIVGIVAFEISEKYNFTLTIKHEGHHNLYRIVTTSNMHERFPIIKYGLNNLTHFASNFYYFINSTILDLKTYVYMDDSNIDVDLGEDTGDWTECLDDVDYYNTSDLKRSHYEDRTHVISFYELETIINNIDNMFTKEFIKANT